MASSQRSANLRDATSAIRTRHRQRIRARFIRGGVVIAVIVLGVGLVWTVWFSSAFVARSVEVTGQSQVSSTEVIQAAQVELGIPLVRLDVLEIRARVEQIPAIAQARISRELSGVVLIDVTERTPVYAIPTSSQYLLVSGDGVGYLSVPEPPEGLPVLTLSVDDSDGSRRLMADAAMIVQALPASLVAQMKAMTAHTPDTFTITLDSGAVVFWGSAEESVLKGQVIEALLKVDASYYDVSSPSHPATR